MKNSFRFAGFMLLVSLVSPMLSASQPSTAVQSALQAMESASGGTVKPTLSPETGLATFVSAAPGKSIPLNAPKSSSAEDRALTFMEDYGNAFGISSGEQLALQKVIESDEVGMDHVRFRQIHNGVPVMGGEIVVHLRGNQVIAVNAKTLPNLDAIKTAPTILPSDALVAAKEVVAKHLKVTDATLSEPRLEIFSREMLDGKKHAVNLAWFIEATRWDVREYIWVDAMSGAVITHFSQITDAKNRSVHDANNSSTLPGTLVRSEGSSASGDVDVDEAYDFSGDTYDYFFNEHGRDSYNNAGAQLISSAHVCDGGCPMQNAFWNGVQMAYGDGFAKDDVAAHELTHAVTEYSANLIYSDQSGALNESFSDIFGETVDLTNGAGNDDSAVRWFMGEEIPGIGAIRNMMDPTLFGNPGKVSDTEYYCGTGDNGGVHINSGVPNHAYALMVDGGAYNGQTITGIGLTKAGKIQYRTLTTYLTSSSTLLDNYNAIQQSCTDLTGTNGITSADCAEVKKSLDAVEMNATPCYVAPVPPPELCTSGQVNNLFFDDLENITSGNWVNNSIVGVNHWNGGAGTPDIYFPDYPISGSYSFWGFDFDTVGDSTAEMVNSIALPVGAHLQFNHSYEFEFSVPFFYDGGVVEYSTDNGANWVDAGGLITAGIQYSGVIDSGFANPLAGRSAFVGSQVSSGSQLDLNSLAGQSARFRFRMGTDSSISAFGWIVDDVQIYTCVDSVPDPFSFTPQTNTTQSTVITSNAITVSGIDTAASISISSGGSYSINGGAYTTVPGTVSNGNTVTVRQTASSLPSTTTTVTLTIGGVNGEFSVTTVAGDGIPNNFTFSPQTGVAVNAVTMSNTITISGIDIATPISISSGGSYSINGGAYTTVAGMVNNGNTVTVRQTASSLPNTATAVTLTIGGVAGTFSVTTSSGDTSPNNFTFTPQTGVPVNSVVTSNIIVVLGIDRTIPITISSGGSYSINAGVYVTVAGTVKNGYIVRVRQRASSLPNTTTSVTLTIGGVSRVFSVTTGN